MIHSLDFVGHPDRPRWINVTSLYLVLKDRLTVIFPMPPRPLRVASFRLASTLLGEIGNLPPLPSTRNPSFIFFLGFAKYFRDLSLSWLAVATYASVYIFDSYRVLSEHNSSRLDFR